MDKEQEHHRINFGREWRAQKLTLRAASGGQSEVASEWEAWESLYEGLEVRGH